MKNDKKYLFDDPINTKRLLLVLYLCCGLLVVLDFVIHRHTLHTWEQLPAFYPLYGFIGCVVLVIVAKWMRCFLMRPEDYYDKPNETDVDSELVNNDTLNSNVLKKQGESHVDD